MFTHAIARQPGPNFAQGLTTANLGAPSYELMLEQHAAYLRALKDLGLEVILLEPLLDYPDAYFVEDAAVIVPEVAVITNPGARSRNGEQEALVPLLAQFRPIARIQPPGTLEGGDVLIVESDIYFAKHAFIGLSERTNRQGAEQLGSILAEHGYDWTALPVGAGLHLKSGVNYVGGNTLLLTEVFAGRKEFSGYEQLLVEEGEAYAANTLLVNVRITIRRCLLTPAGFPQVRQKLEKLGTPVVELQVSEAQKMDGGLTCMSLRF